MVGFRMYQNRGVGNSTEKLPLSTISSLTLADRAMARPSAPSG